MWASRHAKLVATWGADARLGWGKPGKPYCPHPRPLGGFLPLFQKPPAIQPPETADCLGHTGRFMLF